METESPFIIIHPGSYNLYIGYSSDNEPLTVPHVVAYRVKSEDENSLFRAHNWGENQPEIDEISNKALREIAKTLKLLNGITNPSFEYGQKNFNKDSEPLEQCKSEGKTEWLPEEQLTDFIFGHDVFRLNPSLIDRGLYKVKWLFKDVDSATECVTLTELDKCLTCLHWLNSISKLGDVKSPDFSNLGFILLIRDFFNRGFVLSVLDVLFNHIKFSSGTLIQESVAVAFYARLQSLCVVDVGHSTISISCVEEGISLPISRIKLNVGGNMISWTLLHLLKKIDFPVKEFRPSDDIYSFNKLQELKESICHLKNDEIPGQEHEFTWDHPNLSSVYTVPFKVGDEPLLAPIAFFSRPFLNKLFPGMAQPFYYIEYNNSDDVLLNKNSGSEILVGLDTQQQNNQNGACSSSSNSYSTSIDSKSYSPTLDENTLARSQPTPSCDTSPLSSSTPSSKVESSTDSSYSPLTLAENVLSLDEAIMKSIFTCDNHELVCRMFSNIYVVGGGCQFEGTDEFIQHRIEAVMPRGKKFKEISVEVVNKYLDCQPNHVAWKGGSNFCQIESIDDLLITAKQWNYRGSRSVREKVIFQWRHC